MSNKSIWSRIVTVYQLSSMKSHFLRNPLPICFWCRVSWIKNVSMSKCVKHLEDAFIQPTDMRFKRNEGINKTLWKTRPGFKTTLPMPNTGTLVWFGRITNMFVMCVKLVNTSKRQVLWAVAPVSTTQVLGHWKESWEIEKETARGMEGLPSMVKDSPCSVEDVVTKAICACNMLNTCWHCVVDHFTLASSEGVAETWFTVTGVVFILWAGWPRGYPCKWKHFFFVWPGTEQCAHIGWSLRGVLFLEKIWATQARSVTTVVWALTARWVSYCNKIEKTYEIGGMGFIQRILPLAWAKDSLSTIRNVIT